MKRVTKHVLAMSTVAVIGYAAGSLGVFSLPFANATTQPDAAGEMPEMTPEQMAEMEAWIKAGTPGQHHEYLEVLTGDWVAAVHFWMDPESEAMESKGTVSREWVLDGRFLKESVVASTITGEEFEGMGFLGYNNIDGRYEFIWMENMSTAVMMEHGSYNPDEKKFFTYGSQRDPVTGKVVTGWGVLDVSDPDRHTMTAYKIGENGKEYKAFEGVFERK